MTFVNLRQLRGTQLYQQQYCGFSDVVRWQQYHSQNISGKMASKGAWCMCLKYLHSI